MANETIAVKGYRDFLRACDRAGKETRREVRKTLRTVGDAVKTDAADRFAVYDEKTASHFRTIVRQRGVSVEQTLRKTTGTRPDFGSLQMRKALLPALHDKEQETERAMEEAMDKVVAQFAR